MRTTTQYNSLIEEALKTYLTPRDPKGLYDPIIYAMTAGGKRLRPLLCLAAADAIGGNPLTAINQAIGIEMFHNFTLLHDDVMDHSDIRRGRPTVHRKYDERTAILSGDAMLTLATMSISRGCTPQQAIEVEARFNKMAMEVYDGQQYDMDFERRSDVTVDEYLEMIRLKTSVLLGAATAIGALAAGSDSDTADKLNLFGEKLGLSFQLRDDWLDTFGDPATFGKPIGGDILNNKKTWLLISALAADTSGQLAEIIAGNHNPDEKIKRVTKIYLRLDLSKKCRILEEKYATEAIDALSATSLSKEAIAFFEKIALESFNRVK